MTATTSLASMMAPGGLVTWNAPVTREEVVRTLLDRIVPVVPGLSAAEALRHLDERDSRGPTAMGEGIDFPHARIAGVERSVFAIGRTRAGLAVPPADVEAEPEPPPSVEPIHIVWVMLLPPGGAGLGPTAQVARACRDAGFREQLHSASSSDEIRLALERWVLAQAPPAAPWST